MKHQFFAVLIVLLGTDFIFAHPGHEHVPIIRTWKSVDGSFEIRASFVLARDGKVQLLTKEGNSHSIALEKLCIRDQQWVQNKLETIRLINEARIKAASSQQGSQTPVPVPTVSAGATLFALTLITLMWCLVSRKPIQMAALGITSLFVIGAVSLFPAEAGQLGEMPMSMKHFQPFKNKLELRYDDNFLYVGSNGMPDHPMMIGIKSWQQQVPLPQSYTGRNAWRIPLHPKLSDNPISAKTNLYRGAIALAVNGVPIFNALNNRGDDAYLAGELDEYGGHCGRADDYHYHIAPVHLEKIVGKGNPIAYALDGFPLYGYTDAEGKEPRNLDEFNGRMEKDGYRYYSTKTYPYINGGMRGVVTVRGDQVDPQPSASPVRPAGQPLRGAKIIDFIRDDEKKTYTLKYDLRGSTASVKYTINKDASYTFVFTSTSGKETTETYRRRERPPGKGGEGKGSENKKGEGNRKDPPPRKDPPLQEGAASERPRQLGNLKVTSSAFKQGGNFPVEFTGDGEGVSPPVSWSDAPPGTKCYALSLWHIPGPGEVKSYWIIYNIPASVTSLPKNVKGIGKAGYNDKGRTDYDPMKSKGPGTKEYHITVYALSDFPKFNNERVTRKELLAAIKDITLAESTLSYQYERKSK